MTDLRKAAEQVLKAWDKWKCGPFEYEMEGLRQALAQPDWVDLSREEMFELFEKYDGRPFSLMLATHDKVKEKNVYPVCPPCNQDCNEGRDCPARKSNG